MLLGGLAPVAIPARSTSPAISVVLIGSEGDPARNGAADNLRAHSQSASPNKTQSRLPAAADRIRPATSVVVRGGATDARSGLSVTDMDGGAPGAADAVDFNAYSRLISDLIARNCRYSDAARARGLDGVTRIAFRVDRDGGVSDSWIDTSSGSELLDNAALAALDRTGRLPPIPRGLPAPLSFAIEVDAALVRRLAVR